jgi:hypothetical protein
VVPGLRVEEVDLSPSALDAAILGRPVRIIPVKTGGCAARDRALRAAGA